MAYQWEYLDRLREAEDALLVELRRHPLSIVAQINLAHIRKMWRKFEPANDDDRHGKATQYAVRLRHSRFADAGHEASARLLQLAPSRNGC